MKFSCPHCQQHLEADESFIGSTVDCPVCNQPIHIEAPQPPAVPSPLPVEPTPPQESMPRPAEPPLEESPSEVPPATPPPPAPPQAPLPPPAAPPKTAPKFRVVSSPKTRGNQAPNAETPPKTAPKFRVVSRPPARATTGNASAGEPSPAGSKDRKLTEALHERFNDFTGLEKIEGFSLSELLSEIFGKHKPEDIEEFFTVGTQRATPPIEQVDTSWPKPWLFFRALAASILMYLAFAGAYDYFNNDNLIPGMMLMGTLAVPFSTLLFFYEVNVRQNISLYQILRLFFLGGILSLFFSLVLFGLAGETSSEILASALPGPIEETGKLLALLVVARSMRYHYKLNGLLMGAAIGTGFAVFESMGYALRYMLYSLIGAVQGEAIDPVAVMKDVIFIRGVLSPLGHIVWTAIAGAALWRVKGSQPFQVSMLANGKFWHLFLIPVVLHSLWDMPYFNNLPYNGKYLLLGFAAWFVVIALVQEGLKELRAEKLAALEASAGKEEP